MCDHMNREASMVVVSPATPDADDASEHRAIPGVRAHWPARCVTCDVTWPCPDASTATSEPPTEAEREAVDRASLVFGWQHLARYSGQTDDWLRRTLTAIVLGAREDFAAREAAAATKARAEGHRDGYETARSDMVSGAFVGGPTYEALRDSFTGQRIAKDERERIAQAIEAHVEHMRGYTLPASNGDWLVGYEHALYLFARDAGFIADRAARIARGDA